MPTLAKALAHNLPNLRKKLGYTQTELAKKIKSSQKTITQYETGKAGIGSRVIKKLAKALEVEETDLVRAPGLSFDSPINRAQLLALLKTFVALIENGGSIAEASEVVLTLTSGTSPRK